MKLLNVLYTDKTLSNSEILKLFNLKSRRRLRDTYITPALELQLIEMTIPDKPNSRLQKYRLTERGKAEIKK
jgi:hypothetical protein